MVVSTSTLWAADLTASADPTEALIALERSWVAALERSDIETLSALWAQTFVDTDETGHRSNKADVLRALKSGALKLHKIQLSDMKAYIYGDAAVVTGAVAQRGEFQGQPLAGKIVFTDTFVRDGNAWRAVASQRTATK